jgi:hypothetical protein
MRRYGRPTRVLVTAVYPVCTGFVPTEHAGRRKVERMGIRPAPKEDLEREAAWTLAALLSGRPERRDLAGGPDATHDFDVHLPEGRVVALEVTSSTVPEVVEMWDAILVRDWSFPELDRSWSLSLTAAARGQVGARIDRFYKRGPVLLRTLGPEVRWSAGDLLGGPLPHLSSTARQALADLRALGVRHANPVDTMTGGVPLIVLGVSGPAGWVEGNPVNNAVGRAITENEAKLAAADSDERHLFLWVDSTDSPCEAAMATFTLPSDAVDLGGVVDHAWVALWMRSQSTESNIHSMWHVRRRGHWELVVVPRVRTYASRTAP